MISFYPGPSRVHDEIPMYVKDAAKAGIMSINHRSDEFVAMSKKTIGLLKLKLNIPKDYTILYTSSATECWEIIAQSLMEDNSYHLYNGSFGEKWFGYTKRIKPGAQGISFNREEKLDPTKLFFGKNGVICLTQNETSNGTQVSNSIIRAIRKSNPDHLIAIDATSSMAGVYLDFKAGDVWFASVQKCFGLPAGLGLMICSPKAVERAKAINEKDHYNSLPFMFEMMDKWQTPFTTNVLSIYLLMRVMENAEPIKTIDAEVIARYKKWEAFFSHSQNVNLLIQNQEVRSFTVLPIQGSSDKIAAIKKTAKANDILLGEGYGELNKTTFRIANFPAISTKEINTLAKFLKSLV